MTDSDRTTEQLAKTVAELRRRIAELEVSESVLDSVLDCIITMDADGKVVEFNAAAERTFGYTKADAIGRSLADLIIPPRFRDAHAAGLAHYLATGEGAVIGRLIEMTAVRSDGSEIPVELAISAIRSDKGLKFTGVLRDIMERKRAEEEIRQRAQLSALGAQVGLSLITADSLARALQQCAEALVTHMGAAVARIWTLNERERRARTSGERWPVHGREGSAGKDSARAVEDRAYRAESHAGHDQHRHRRSRSERSGLGAARRAGRLRRPPADGGRPRGRRHGALCPACAVRRRHLGDGVCRRSRRAGNRAPSERRRAADGRRAHAVRARGGGRGNLGHGLCQRRAPMVGDARSPSRLETRQRLQGRSTRSSSAFTPTIGNPCSRQFGKAMQSGADFSTLHRSIWPDGTRAMAERRGARPPRRSTANQYAPWA